MARLVSGFGAIARRAPLVVLTALATHAAVYRSLAPGDGAHGYFAWYTPLVTGLSGLSILGLPLVLVLVLALTGGWDSRVARTSRCLVPRTEPGGTVLPEAVRLTLGACVFLAVQETLERSLELDRLALPNFAPSSWLVLVVAVATLAVASALVGRALWSLVNVVRRVDGSPSLRPVRSGRPHGVAESPRRSRPLAVHGGLRAPPVTV